MHPSDEALAALVIGDEADPAVAEHVRSCPRCAALLDELNDLTTGLTEAAQERLVQPPDALWARIAADTSASDEPQPATDGDPAPDRPDSPSRPARRFGRAWLVGGVAAGVAIGLLAATVLPQVGQPRAQVVAQTSLDTLDTGRTQGRATVTSQAGALDLTLTVEPLHAGSGFLEVWLINTDKTRMVSVGVLPNGSTQQEFPITATLLEQGYVIVDISREPFDDRPQHSGDSLLRGELS